MFGSIQNFLMFIFCSPKSKLTESLLMFRAEFYDTVNVKNQEMQRLRDLYAEPESFKQCCWCSKYFLNNDLTRHPKCVSNEWHKAGATVYHFLKVRNQYTCLLCG